MSRRTTVTIAGKRVQLSNIEKLMYPEAGFTKADVLRYYADIASAMLPHLTRRPVSLKRYPDGVTGKHFYQKNCPAHRPAWLETVSIERAERRGDVKSTKYCIIDDEAALLWTVNTGSIELHTQLYTVENIDRPTTMIFDLDPGPGAGMSECARVAMELRSNLDGLGLQCFVKTSGGKGLHVAVPINGPGSFAQTKLLSRALAESLERRHPSQITSRMRKDLRSGKVFVDWSQNDQHKTTVCVYSLRARTRPTVSTPVTWEEVAETVDADDAGVLTFGPADVVDRVHRLGDLFLPVAQMRQALPREAVRT